MKRIALTAAVLAASALPGYLSAAPAITNAGFNNNSTPPVLTGGASLGFTPGYFTGLPQLPQEGSGALVLHGAGTAALTISSLITGAPYRLTYGEATRYNSLANDLQVKVDGATTVPDYFPSNALWADHSFIFTASSTQVPLEFDGVYSDNSGDRTSLVDNVRIIPVYIWQSGAPANWGATTSWVGSVMPNGIDQIAIFGQAGASGSVNLDAARTVGSVEFNAGGGPYSIATSNASALTLQSSTNAASMVNSQGSHTVSAPVILQSNTTFNVANAQDTLTLSGPLTATGMAITQRGFGTLAVANLRAADLTINQGTVHVLPNGAAANVSILDHISFTGSVAGAPGPRDLAIIPDGALDLDDNDAVLKSGYSLDQVRGLLEFGYSFGFWGGQGITSRAAANMPNTALGYLKGSDFATMHPGDTFDSQAVASNDILIKFTYMGDADLDGRITMSDYAQIDAGFLLHAPVATWVNGDFNYDGIVDYQDYALIDAAFRAQGGALANDMITLHAGEFGPSYGAAMYGLTAGTVPEPASVALLALGATALLRRRR